MNLALQGGGAHGAFTWGALDRLLDEKSIDIEGVTATSAGAMNAAALKRGWTEGGRAGAKAALSEFWLSLAGLEGGFSDAIIEWLRLVSPAPAVTARALEFAPQTITAEAITRVFSPYQFNPLNYHPLRAVVEALAVDGSMHSDIGPKLFVSATNVRDGKPRIFMGKEITVDAILASACLPTVFQAIEIDDPRTGRREAYWDGGYIGNPALYPLHYHTHALDLVIIHINPLRREELPRTAQEIASRINEISFNAALLQELRGIHFVNRLLDEGLLPPDRMKRNHVHSVSDDALMNQLGVVTKMTPNKALLLQLHDAGITAMDQFLTRHWEKIGTCSSVDVQDILDSPGGRV